MNDMTGVKDADKAFKLGDFNEAKLIAKKCLEEDLNSVELNSILGCVYYEEEKWEAASHHLAIAMDTKPRYDILLRLCNSLLSISTHASLGRARHYAEISHRLRPREAQVVGQLAQICSQIGPWDGALKWSRLLVSMLPDDASTNFIAARTIATTPDFDPQEVMSYLDKSISIKPDILDNPIFKKDFEDLKSMVAKVKNKTTQKTRIARYPTTDAINSNLKSVIKKNLVSMYADPQQFIFPDTRFFSMGSCFARNVSASLEDSGYYSFHTEVSEYINTTFANRVFTDWLLEKCSTSHTERVEEIISGRTTREEILENINNANVYIFTMGVVPAFFERESGDFVMPRPTAINARSLAEKFKYRTTGVQENLENIEYIINSIRSINPDLKVVLTVSPVPIQATFEFGSAVGADCLSKSTLRIVAHELMQKELGGIIYWPSFEIVRWLGCHTGPVFGTDDGAAWHVSESLIDTIVQIFIETYSGEPN